MAGDWIKMRTDLLTSPKVVRIASALKADRLRVVGGLFSAWCLFDIHSVDGELSGYTTDVLDDLIGFDGFSSAMVAVGWLIQDGESLVMPEFESHNGQSAKRRAQDAERKRTVRKVSVSEADKMRTREEKRREEIVVPAKVDATVVELRPEQQQPAGLCLDNPTAFAKSVAEAYAKAYGVGVPPVPLMTAMSIAQRIDFYPATAELSWWEVYFQLCFEDLYLTNRESLDQPLGKKAARFDNLISEKTISTMVDRNNREAAHA